MRLSTPLACLVLTLTVAARGDDLFSEIAVESVFGAATKGGSTATDTASSVSPVPLARVTGAGQLGELLREAGMEPERVDGKTVTVTIRHGQWTIPTTLHAAVERSQIDVTMGLATPAKGSKWDAAKLLKLLANPEEGGVYFAFDSEKGQVQVRQTLSARGLTASELGRLLPEMAEFAVSRESAWYAETKATTTTAPATGATADSLVGSWVASLGAGEAFAIKFTSDNKFQLAYVKAGKTTTSAGKAERTGDTLKLVGDKGATITGTLASLTSSGFDLTLTGGKKLSFKKSTK